MSALLIISTNFLKLTFGFHFNIFFALSALPLRLSTSEGLKNLGSTLIIALLVSTFIAC